MHSFSIIIPIFNEEKNILNLLSEISKLNFNSYHFEIIIVDDKSQDNSVKILEENKDKFNFKLLKNKKNRGQSYSIRKGISNSLFDTIITIDGDCQNDPADIPNMLKIYTKNKNLKLVAGERRKRKDTFLKIISSRIANNFRSFILKDKCKDTGCSLKIFDKNIFLLFPFFNGLHRFIPSLFTGFSYEVEYVKVNHRNRIYGNSNYGTFKRLVKGLIDTYRVYKIIKENKNGKFF